MKVNQLYITENYLKPILVLDYIINSDKSTVYNAWTELEIFKKWFCPTGFSIAKAELTPKPGGFFTIHMQSPEGEIYPTKGEYIILQKPDRIVYKDSWDDDRVDNEAITSEIVFETIGDKTILKLYASFANTKQKEKTLNSGIVDGWKMFFENLNTVLNK